MSRTQKTHKFASSDGKEDVTVTVYSDLTKCIEACWGLPIQEITNWGGCDLEENECEITVDEAISDIKECGCWGVCNNKNEIHLWMDKNVDPRQLIRLLAHERGHMLRPYHREFVKEESKACRYEDCAMFSYDVTMELLKTYL
jgi:hypothetical protein